METNALLNYSALPDRVVTNSHAVQFRGSSCGRYIQTCAYTCCSIVPVVGAVALAAFLLYVPLNVWIDCTSNPTGTPPCDRKSLLTAKIVTVLLGSAYLVGISCLGGCFVNTCFRSRRQPAQIEAHPDGNV